MKHHLTHANTGNMPPWSSPDQWQEAGCAMTAVLGTRGHRFDALREWANLIRARLLYLDRFMNTLCADTCPDCTDNCCQRATVWYDFKDLLGFHLGMASVPTEQFTPLPKRPCQYLGSAGCTLSRLQRPFICTWYICAAQHEAMAAWAPSRKQYLINSLVAIKSARNRMEHLFIGCLQT